MRLVQAARLSRLADTSTGLDKQDEAANRYALAYDHQIIDTASDADVSGSVAPWERPALKRWLSGPLLSSYDGLIAANLDRFGRNARHLAWFRDWAEDNGKKLIVISPALQWPPEPDDLASPIIWDVLARLAEYELAAITKRNRETQAWLRANDYLVGRPPFGYRTVPKDDHKTLEPDPEYAPVVRELARQFIAGASTTVLAYWLDSQGIPTPSDVIRLRANQPSTAGKWWHSTIAKLFRNSMMIGQRRDKHGNIVLRVEPLVDISTWRQVIARLDTEPHKRGSAAPDTAMLTGVIFCGKCESAMYRTKMPRKASGHEVFYACRKSGKKSSCRNMLSLTDMDARVNEAVMAYAEYPQLKTVLIPGSGHMDELNQIRQSIRDLGMQDLDDTAYDQELTRLRNERDAIASLPVEPDRYERTQSGRSTGEVWEELDTAGKRSWLLHARWRVLAHRDEEREIIVTIEAQDFLSEVLSLGEL